MGRTDFIEVQQSRQKTETIARLEFLLGEHVEAFGSFTHLSDFQHVSRHQMSPGAPMAGKLFGLAEGGRKARALPTSLCLVITPTRVVATSFPDRPPGRTEEHVVGAWDRATMSVEVADATAAADPGDTRIKVTLHLLDEDRPVQLESFDQGSDVNEEILTLLRQ